jgi:hypothetical protein
MLNPFSQRKDSDEMPKGEEQINKKKDISKFLPKNNRKSLFFIGVGGMTDEGRKIEFSKKLGKFVKKDEAKSNSQEKKGGFSLTRFWKKA